MNKQELAKMIDQTLLKPYVSLEDLRRHCVQAAEYGFKTVAINNAPVPFCKAILEGFRRTGRRRRILSSGSVYDRNQGI